MSTGFRLFCFIKTLVVKCLYPLHIVGDDATRRTPAVREMFRINTTDAQLTIKIGQLRQYQSFHIYTLPNLCD